MQAFICTACGTRYPDATAPPARCFVCEDERQFVPRGGQRWTAPDALAADHANAFRQLAPGLLAITTMPSFAIGQRALLLRTPDGNVLWDCLSLLDPATAEIVAALGGLAAVAVSHPHFFSAMADWGRSFGCPVLVHAADRDRVVLPDPCLRFWDGDSLELLPDLTLHRLGGHFPGSAVLHWRSRRMLLTGDTVMVVPDRRHVTFMWSYPNAVPLPAAEVRRIGDRLAALDFDAAYGAFPDREIEHGAKAAVARSVDRYVAAVTGPGPLA